VRGQTTPELNLDAVLDAGALATLITAFQQADGQPAASHAGLH
jgi:hypothetical protein